MTQGLGLQGGHRLPKLRVVQPCIAASVGPVVGGCAAAPLSAVTGRGSCCICGFVCVCGDVEERVIRRTHPFQSGVEGAYGLLLCMGSVNVYTTRGTTGKNSAVPAVWLHAHVGLLHRLGYLCLQKCWHVFKVGPGSGMLWGEVCGLCTCDTLTA